jgi:hypothetical protein
MTRVCKIANTDLASSMVVGTMKLVTDINTYKMLLPSNRNHTKLRFAGQNPFVYRFSMASESRDDMNSAIRAIKTATEGDRFYPVKDDRYALVALADAYGTDDIPAVAMGTEDYLYQADAEVYCLDPFFYSDAFTAFDSETLGDFSDVENAGDLATAPVIVYVGGRWDGSHLIASPNYSLYESDHSTRIGSICLVTEIHTDENIIFEPLRNRITQKYTDLMTDDAKTQRDIADFAGTPTYGNGYTKLTNEWIAYSFQSDYPLNEPPKLHARLNPVGGDAQIWYQTEELGDWKAGPPIQPDILTDYYFDGAAGAKEFTMIFQSGSAGVDLYLYGIDITLRRWVPDDDIPVIEPGYSGSWTVEVAAGTALHMAGRYHDLYVRS